MKPLLLMSWLFFAPHTAEHPPWLYPDTQQPREINDPATMFFIVGVMTLGGFGLGFLVGLWATGAFKR